jgi:hypothetical protein
MKVFSVVMKIVVALAAIAGAVYVAATYGDKIVAWAKKLLGKCECCCGCDCDRDCECDEECCEGECCCEEKCECCCAEEAAEEAPAEEAPAEEAESAATEADFEG